MCFRRTLQSRLLACFVLILCWGPAGAGSLAINPIRLDLSAESPTAAMTLRNSGETPTLAQLTLVEWSIADGEDRYTPNRDLLVTPPIFIIEPGERQIVRLGLRNPAPAPAERAYRLFIQEPPSEDPDRPGLKVALRIGVPVFVAPAGPPNPQIDWRAVREGENALRIEAMNTGNVHVKLSDIRATAADPEKNGEWAVEKGFAYLLPGTSLHWTIETGNISRGERLRLSADTDTARGVIEVELEPEAP